MPLYAHLRQTKNDIIDALSVADVICFGRYCETQVAPENIVALRELCRQRFFIADTASDFKRKIIVLLDQTFPEYEKLFSETFGKTSVELFAIIFAVLCDNKPYVPTSASCLFTAGLK